MVRFQYFEDSSGKSILYVIEEPGRAQLGVLIVLLLGVCTNRGVGTPFVSPGQDPGAGTGHRAALFPALRTWAVISCLCLTFPHAAGLFHPPG